MTDKLIMTTEQREQSLTTLKEVDVLLSNLNQSRHRGLEAAIAMLQSLPMGSAEPVARLLHCLKPLLVVNATIARSYEEYFENSHPDTWREGTKLYTSPQALTPISADDVTDEMVKAYLKLLPSPLTYQKILMTAYNAVIKHRSEA